MKKTHGGIAMDRKVLQFIDRVLKEFGIPVSRIEPPFSDSDIADMGLNGQVIGVDINKLNARALNIKESVIYQFKDKFECHYTVFRLPEQNEIVIIGPLLLEEINGKRFDELFSELKLTESMRQPLQSYYYGLKQINYGAEFETFTNILGDCIFGEGQYEIIYLGSNRVSIYSHTHDRMESEEDVIITFQHTVERYQAVDELLSAIANGNERLANQRLAALQSHMKFPYLHDELRMSKNDSIILNSLLQYTAVRTGVHAIHVDTLHLRYMTHIEGMQTVQQCKNVQREMVHNYCELISNYNFRQYSPPIRKAISYITSDLTADLSLKTLAKRININPTYLSSLFRQELGIPLTEYVNRRRIDHAEHLLANSDLDLKNVAIQCGIRDIYYFNKLFKRYKGITPKAYKDTVGDSSSAVSQLPDIKLE